VKTILAVLFLPLFPLLLLLALLCGCSTPLPRLGATVLDDGTICHVLTRADLQHAAQLATHAPLAPSEYGFALPVLTITSTNDIPAQNWKTP
jgi:hypothetical protein